jgi:hypothetical protein
VLDGKYIEWILKDEKKKTTYNMKKRRPHNVGTELWPFFPNS